MKKYTIEADEKIVKQLQDILQSKDYREDYLQKAIENLKDLDEKIIELEGKLEDKRKKVEILEKSVETPKTVCNCKDKPRYTPKVSKSEGRITFKE